MGDYRCGLSCELRVELARHGITKEDFDRKGVSMDDLLREALRMFEERDRRVAGIASELLGRAGFVSPPLA